METKKQQKSYNMGQYIFKIKDKHLWVIDNPITDLSSMDFFDILKIDGIYNYKGKSNNKDFAIALMVNGNFYYRTVDNTKENIAMYKSLLDDVNEIKTKSI